MAWLLDPKLIAPLVKAAVSPPPVKLAAPPLTPDASLTRLPLPPTVTPAEAEVNTRLALVRLETSPEAPRSATDPV